MLKNERVGATQENREGVKDQARGEERKHSTEGRGVPYVVARFKAA